MGRYRVVGYYDMRPVDWASGKRVPLSPGEGHVCDRCGAEHAVVYEVEDTEGNGTYRVGSSCAKASFGFEPDREGKLVVKAAKERAAAELDAVRQEMIREGAALIAGEVSHLAAPDCVPDRSSYPGTTAWRCGDGVALAAHGRSDVEARAMAHKSWVENRVRERVPAEWGSIGVLYRPGTRDKTQILMSRKAVDLAVRALVG